MILFLFLTCFTYVSAATAAQNELSALLHAKSVAELESASSAASAVRFAHELCVSELRARLLPRDCFRELTLRERSVSEDRASFAERSRLRRVCVENARVSRSRLDLSAPGDVLPADCRRAAGERLEDLRYIDEAKHPAASVMRTGGLDLE